MTALQTLLREHRRYAVLARRARFMERDSEKAVRMFVKSAACLALLQIEISDTERNMTHDRPS